MSQENTAPVSPELEAEKPLKLNEKWARMSDDGAFVVVKLRVPVDFGPEKIDTITMRADVTAGDLEAMDRGKGTVNQSMHLAASISGVPVAILRKLRAVDFVEVQNTAAFLMGKDK